MYIHTQIKYYSKCFCNFIQYSCKFCRNLGINNDLPLKELEEILRKFEKAYATTKEMIIIFLKNIQQSIKKIKEKTKNE